MRMNIAVDDNLVTEALQLSKLKTKKELINAALREFIRNRKKLNLTEIKGKIVFREDYDYKKMRT
ncbi:MAG: type II toxin-antitoxin system VapB family antitoxin [Candidatus Aminicenantes bacterium]|nr:type II toxin-antitoxin system VapB family antitoxin [Candidatus Aminicenantes bacterium]